MDRAQTRPARSGTAKVASATYTRFFMTLPTARSIDGAAATPATRASKPVARTGPARDDPDPPITREQLAITAAILTGISLAALDSSVVGTAMPTIIGQLGGLAEYSWVFTGYLLASTTTVPLFSKLADMYGRKPIFMFGLILFVVASLTCGFATTMLQLVVFRTIQGVGAGALQPVAFTIVGDIYTPAQRAKVQGLFSAVWGGTAIIGPAIGGVITTTVGWPWVFWINLPIGIIAAVAFMRIFKEKFERVPHKLDLLGASPLTAGVALLLFALSEGGAVFGYSSPQFVGMVSLSILIILGFLSPNDTAKEPLIDFTLLNIPVIRCGLAIGALTGVVMYGLTTYVPPLIQGVDGGTPVEAGLAVSAMSIGWPIGSMLGGRLMLRYGTRRIVLIGSFLRPSAARSSRRRLRSGRCGTRCSRPGSRIRGWASGPTTIMVSTQGSVAWNRRDDDRLVQFSRSIGGSIGLGFMGGILTAAVGSHPAAVLDPFTRDDLTPAELAATRAAIEGGLSLIFWIICVAGIAAFFVAVRTMPSLNIRELRRGRPAETDAEAIEAGLALEGGVEFG